MVKRSVHCTDFRRPYRAMIARDLTRLKPELCSPGPKGPASYTSVKPSVNSVDSVRAFSPSGLLRAHLSWRVPLFSRREKTSHGGHGVHGGTEAFWPLINRLNPVLNLTVRHQI